MEELDSVIDTILEAEGRTVRLEGNTIRSCTLNAQGADGLALTLTRETSRDTTIMRISYGGSSIAYHRPTTEDIPLSAECRHALRFWYARCRKD